MADELHDLISDAYGRGYLDALEDAGISAFRDEHRAEGCAQFQADTKDRQAALNARPSPTNADAPEGLVDEVQEFFTEANAEGMNGFWCVSLRYRILAALRHPTADEGDALLREARAFVESDLYAAKDTGDADWIGQSHDLLTRIDAHLGGQEHG
jgi:hypothetical protein